ncbi:MAG: hypothetical protein RR546_07835, partial [Erysipelotrichaceae bacterium]
VMQDTDNLFQGAAELLSRIDGVRPFEYNSIRYKIEKHRETNYWLTRYASKIHGEFGMREAAFRDDLKPVVERLSIITLDGNKIKNTDRTITESGPQWTSSHSGTSMDQHTSSVQLEYSTAMKEEVCFSDLEKDVKFKDLELVFKQMKEEREIALGRSVTIQEEFNLRDKYYKQRSITNFEHSMDSDLEGISKFLDYCPIIGGVKQTLEGIIGTTMSGELINDLEAKNMVVMGIFSTGIDLIPLGSILKSCNTVKSLAVAATKDIVTSEAIGYTNSFMASCGAPPSSLIIMNLLATSVFTHYNKVSPIKDFDVTPPKVKSDNIDGLQANKESSGAKTVDDWFKNMSLEDVVRYKQRLNLLEGKIPDFIEGIKVIDGKVGGKIPVTDYLAIRDASVHNSYSNSMTLGKYFDDNISYIESAKNKSSMFFDLGDDWNIIKDKYCIGDDEIFEIFNKSALDDAVKNGKKIRFSHDPRLPKYSGSALGDEWSYLMKHHGFKDLIEKEGGIWLAIQ